jgi:hypothetical protein
METKEQAFVKEIHSAFDKEADSLIEESGGNIWATVITIIN